MKKTPDPIDKHVGSRVRMQRMLTGMSQEKLGEAIGLTFQQVQKYEKGTNRIGASRLQQISQALGKPMSFFFEGAPQPNDALPQGFAEDPGSDNLMEFIATTEGMHLNKAFVRIKDPRVRKRVVDLVQSLAEVQPDTETTWQTDRGSRKR